MAPLPPIKRPWIAACICAALGLSFVIPPVLHGAGFAYKNYILRKEGGREILCDPYVVQKNDWILKIFKLRGEIAQSDFPRFLKLFRRINPHIHNINTIRPGQHILIPLKEMTSGPVAREPSGVVQVPFLDLTRGPKTPGPPTRQGAGAITYRVQAGDCISKLLAARFGDYGTASYKAGLRRFRRVNPGIRDLDHLSVGQVIQLPGPGVARSGFSSPPAVAARGPVAFAPVRTGYDLYRSARQEKSRTAPGPTALEQAASLLEARLLDQGIFYFPRPEADDLPMDMAQVPVMTLANGRRLLFPSAENRLGHLMETVRNHWRDASAIVLPPGADMGTVLDAITRALGEQEEQTSADLEAGGLAFSVHARWMIDLPASENGSPGKLCITMIEDSSQKTPPPLARYLADRQIMIRDVVRSPAPLHRPAPDDARSSRPPRPTTVPPGAPRVFVPDLIRAMGYTWAGNVTISFPYAGIQVEAVSNLVTTPSGIPLFVDFQDLFGDAVTAIKKSGFRIVQVTGRETPRRVVKKLLTALDSEITENSRIIAADRPARFNTTVLVPGLMIRNDNANDLLITELALPPDIGEFLREKGIRVIMLSPDNGMNHGARLNG